MTWESEQTLRSGRIRGQKRSPRQRCHAPGPTPERRFQCMPESKRCPRCRETKPLDEYYRAPSQRSGYSNYCKVCSRRNARDGAIKKAAGKKCQRCGQPLLVGHTFCSNACAVAARADNARGRSLYEERYTVEDRGYETPCWISPAHGHSAGYGREVLPDGRRMYAHRRMYEETYGPIPAGLVPDHLCRVTACIRPDHLELVTSAENVRRGDRAKLDWEKVGRIREAIVAGERIKDIAARFEISASVISNIKAGRAWSI